KPRAITIGFGRADSVGWSATEGATGPRDRTTAEIPALTMFFMARLGERSSRHSARIAPDYHNCRRSECDLAHRSRHCVVDPNTGVFDFRQVMMSALATERQKSMSAHMSAMRG